MILPIEFAYLEDLAEQWCVPDDVDRSERMDRASDEELKTLVERLSPHFKAINAYLDEHQDDAACELGTLAEAACEA